MTLTVVFLTRRLKTFMSHSVIRIMIESAHKNENVYILNMNLDKL